MKKLSGGNFIFIIFLIIMVYNSFQSGRFNDPGLWLLLTLLKLPGIVIGITFHEFAHAFSAWKLGDHTPKAQKRVTLNPLSHIDPIGIIALVFIGFGWGKPVQVNPYAFRKNPRRANLIVDIAGVVTNFVIAFVLTGVFVLIGGKGLPSSDFLLFTCIIIAFAIYINLVLMIFNLIPIPPLDGFGIITEIFDLRRFSWYRPFYQNGTIILLALIVFGAIGALLGPALFAILDFLCGIWGIDPAMLYFYLSIVWR